MKKYVVVVMGVMGTVACGASLDGLEAKQGEEMAATTSPIANRRISVEKAEEQMVENLCKRLHTQGIKKDEKACVRELTLWLTVEDDNDKNSEAEKAAKVVCHAKGVLVDRLYDCEDALFVNFDGLENNNIAKVNFGAMLAEDKCSYVHMCIE